MSTLDKIIIILIQLWRIITYSLVAIGIFIIIQGLVYRLSHKKINLYKTGKKILYKLLEI